MISLIFIIREASSSVQTAEADPIQAKKEEVEVSLSKKTDAEIQQKPLKPHHRLALAAYATSRAVLPTQQSRRTWSNKNNVSEGLVTDFLNEIVRKNRKEKNGTNDKWKIPKELVTPDDPRFHSTEAKDSSTETKDEGPAEPPAGLDHPNSDPVQAPPSPQQTVQEKPRSSPAPAPASAPDVPMNDTNANHNPVPTSSMNTGNQADIPQQTSMPQGDLTQAQNPSDPVQINFPPDMTQEIYELLVQHRFFTLVEGPFGVTFEDMLNWPAFEAKLRLHECSLRPRFVWRLLKMFYFFF